jgi:hypothetical protein
MKILVSGASYVAKKEWPNYLLDGGHDIVNLGSFGAGNHYITNSVQYNIKSHRPDFVFILWSGINRHDLRILDHEIFDEIDHAYPFRTVGSSRFLHSGLAVDVEKGWLRGYQDVKEPDWPDVDSLQQWFDLPSHIKKAALDHRIYLSTQGSLEGVAPWMHQYFLVQNLIYDEVYLSELTWQHMMNCHNLLERHRIPYRFAFIYDIWQPSREYGQAHKTRYHDEIDWHKFIELPPFEWGVRHDVLDKDQHHLTPDGMIQWTKELNTILLADKNLTAELSWK